MMALALFVIFWGIKYMNKTHAYFDKYIERVKQLAEKYYVERLKVSKIKLTDLSPEVREFFGFVSGYSTGRLVVTLYSEYIEPLRKKLKKYLVIMAIIILLLTICIIYIWATFDFGSFKIIMLLLIPALVGLSYTFIKGLKYWSESKKNLAEAEKFKKELE